MSKRTAIIVGNYGPSLYSFRGRLMAELVKRGYRVLGCAPELDQDTQDRLMSLGVETRDLPMRRGATNPLDDLRLFWRLYRFFRTERPDVVLTYTIKPVVYGNMAARLACVPRKASIIAGLGSSFPVNGGVRLVGAVAKSLYALAMQACDIVCFQNPDDLNVFYDQGLISRADEAHVVSGSGVDLSEYPVAPLPPRPRFILVGRMIAEKGVREFRSAAANLRVRHPGASFALAGWCDTDNPGGIAREEIDKWVADGDIDYLGAVSHVRSLLADASVFVLPSYYREGTPRTILEAMSMGRAIITTDSPGCRETVMDGINGFLLPVRDVAALEDAMERFIDDPELQVAMGHESRRLCEERFDVNIVNDHILSSLLKDGH